MRTRDWLKYGLAGSIALGTLVCIVALEVAKQSRRKQDPQEQRVIQQTLDTFGQVDRPPTAPPPAQPGS